MDNAVDRVLGLINNLPRFVLDRVGAVLLSSADGDCGIGEIRYGVFSGTLIRADVAARVCCRDDFFLDQADHDMYSRIRELGYFTLVLIVGLLIIGWVQCVGQKYYIS